MFCFDRETVAVDSRAVSGQLVATRSALCPLRSSRLYVSSHELNYSTIYRPSVVDMVLIRACLLGEEPRIGYAWQSLSPCHRPFSLFGHPIDDLAHYVTFRPSMSTTWANITHILSSDPPIPLNRDVRKSQYIHNNNYNKKKEGGHRTKPHGSFPRGSSFLKQRSATFQIIIAYSQHLQTHTHTHI